MKGTVSMVKIPPKSKLNITVGEKMEKIKNISKGTLAFRDDDGKQYDIKAGETVECNYKQEPGDPRLVKESSEKKKKKEVN